MSFGLSRGRQLDPSVVAISDEELGALPDEILTDPTAGRLDVRAWFADPAKPLEIEVGSGKGTFLVQQASLQPERNFLGIEYAREFFVYAADRIRRHGMTNVRLLGTDAKAFLTWRVGDGIAEVVHLYFPDPWPKARHNRRRMLQDDFLAQCYRILKPGGEIRVVTDHADYWAWMESYFDRWCSGEGVDGMAYDRLPFERPASAGEGEVVGTNFERKYRREGRPFFAAVLRRRGMGKN